MFEENVEDKKGSRYNSAQASSTVTASLSGSDEGHKKLPIATWGSLPNISLEHVIFSLSGGSHTTFYSAFPHGETFFPRFPLEHKRTATLRETSEKVLRHLKPPLYESMTSWLSAKRSRSLARHTPCILES